MAADRIVLTIPAQDEYARTVRMTAVALVSRNASIDLLDDVRIAVDEAFIHVCELSGHGGEITFEFIIDEKTLDVRVGPLAAPQDEDAIEAAQSRYSRFILESVCDEFETCDEEGAVYLRLKKRLSE